MAALKELGKHVVKDRLEQLWQSSDLVEHIHEHAAQHMSDELTTIVADEITAYAIPGIAHGFYAAKGWNTSGEEMDRRLGVLAITAMNFHTQVMVPIAYARVL
jgi:hypothetical protein